MLTQAFQNMFETRSAGTQVSGSGGFFSFFGGDGKNTFANEKSALTLSAFYNGVDQLSNDIAKLPKSVFKKNDENLEKFTDHPVNYLIANKPNDLMNAFDFWKVIEYTKIVKGNAYALIVRNSNTAEPTALVYLQNHEVRVFISQNKLYYDCKNKTYASEDILHFKGFSVDGIMGVGVITFAAKQLGISLDSQSFQQDVYKDRGLGYGVIESDQDVNIDNKKAIEKGFAAKMAGKSKFKVPMLDAGMKYKSISVTPAEAQFLESNKMGVIEVCRWLNIAPHKLKELSEGTYSNIYQQSIEHVIDSIMPSVISKEQEINNKLFSRKNAGVVYVKFNINSLLRGDLQMKKEFYTAMVYAGVYTRNEIRAFEEMNPIDGLGEPLQPVNMQALSLVLELQKQQEKNGNSN